MTKRISKLKAPRAIKKALKRYKNGNSGLHREIYAILQTLRSELETLTAIFKRRRDLRREIDDVVAKTRLKEAQDTLSWQQKRYEMSVKSDRVEIRELARNYLRVAKENVKSVSLIIDRRRDLSRQADSIESQFELWIDSFIAHAVEGLNDEQSFKLALATLSGGLIYLGLSGDPSIAVSATVASSAILCVEIKNIIDKDFKAKKLDQAIRREEAILRLMEELKKLSAQWLKALNE